MNRNYTVLPNTATLLQTDRLISERVHDVSKSMSPRQLKYDAKTT